MLLRPLVFGAALTALVTAPAHAQQAAPVQAAPSPAAPTVISPGTGGAAATGGVSAGVAATGTPATVGGTSTPAQAQQGAPTVFPPVENIVPGSQGEVVQPPVESITGAGNGQVVFPPVESGAVNTPGGFPFESAQPGTVLQEDIFTNEQQVEPRAGLSASETGGVGTGTVTTGQQLTDTLAGTTGTLGSGAALQQIQQNRAALATGGWVGARAPVMPDGTGPGSRPGDPDWVVAPVEQFDPDEPDALDYSRSP